MKMSRSHAVALFLFLAACGGGNGAEKGAGEEANVPEADRYGGTAVVGLGQDIPDINPLTSTDNYANQAEMFILFTPVLRYNERFEPIPALARSWELNADSTELTFHLRNDVFWHDGRKTTAHDLKYAYDTANDPKTAYPNTAFWTHYGASSVPDSFTFKVKMKPHAEYLDPWRTFFAVPRHILGGVKPEALANHPYSTRSPVGNGPFRFESRVAGQSWTFGANPTYPKELGGRPYLDRVVLRIIPEAATRLTELLTGKLDYYIQVSPEQAQRVKSSPQGRIETFPNRLYTLIGWNQRRPPFDDPRVRRALSMAINKQAIIDGVLYGYGTVAHASVPPMLWQADTTVGKVARYDPDAARRLLAEAGWQDRNRDGTLENAQGKPFRFVLKTNQGNQERKDVTEVVQSELKKIGVDATPALVEFGTLLEQLQTPKLRDFDAVIIGWVTEFKPDDMDLFHCDRRDQPFQWVGHCNPETDRYLDTLQTIVDRDAARPVWSAYQRHIAEQQPYTFLFFQERVEGVNRRLQNVDPDARGDLVGIDKWWILPTARAASTPAQPQPQPQPTS